MAENAVSSNFPDSVNVNGDFPDDCLPPDPLLQSGTYIHADSNATVETTPERSLLDEPHVSDPMPAAASTESTAKIQTVSTELVTPKRRLNKSVEVTSERPSWLPKIKKTYLFEEFLDFDYLAITVEIEVEFNLMTWCAQEKRAKDDIVFIEGQSQRPSGSTGGNEGEVCNRSSPLNGQRYPNIYTSERMQVPWEQSTCGQVIRDTTFVPWILQYFFEPVSGRKFRSKVEVLYFLETGGKRKKGNTGSEATPSETSKSQKQKKGGSKTQKITSFYFDSGNPPHSVCWVQTDGFADTWAPSCNGGMIPERRRQEWVAVFSSVSQLRRRNV
ncbi:PREDICTED: uncharacterized protein LOC109230157 [Nicotiana attenuata]|uniref:uncharacterized protein LOC109230157 n=1 Tax=Nicotiana attenuata TaxID=49451 RepID=UPI000905C727|nr:PREDICTED: uncharacterized protein LOC109230157 [Nicotiana attenuata]